MIPQLRELLLRIRSLFRRKQLDRELDTELRSHLDMAVERNLAQGMSPEQARREALLNFGGLEQTKEVYRERRGLPFLDTLFQDLRFASRILRKSPGFTAVAVLTLALGIGANTAIYSLIDAALLRSLPVHDPQRLVIFQWSALHSPNTKGQYGYMSCPSLNASGKHGCSFSYPMFHQFRALQNTFSSVIALGGDAGLNLRGNGPASFVHGELVSGEFFDTLGVGAALGRTFTTTDDTPAAPPVAVLSYGFWQRAFGADPTAVGKTVWLNNVPVTIVGVAAKEFPGLDPARARQIWLPLAKSPELGKDLYGNMGGDRPSLEAGDGVLWVYLVARLKEGIGLDQAQAAADASFHNDVLDKTKELFKAEDAPRLVLMPAPQAISGLRERFSTPLTILMTAVGLVLLVACANVAGLMLARSATRQREMAVRLTLGAGRARIARQLLTESVLLSAAGGTAGILLAYWSMQSLVGFMSRGGLWPSRLAAHLDLRVLVFSATASVVTGILFGLAPAFRSFRMDLTPALKESATSFIGKAWHGRWFNLGGSLVVAQMALAILVLSGAGLLVRTLKNLKSIDPGFETRNLLLFNMDTVLNGYTEQQTHTFYSQLLERIEALPGALSATCSFDSLLSGNYWDTSFEIAGEAQHTHHETFGLNAGPKFFETMGIPLMAGRVFGPQDFPVTPTSIHRTSTPSASAAETKLIPVIINEAFVRSFFRDQNPLGRQISNFGNRSTGEIIGVVGDTKFQTLRSEIAPTLFVPGVGTEATFEVRTAVDPRTMVPALRNIVSQLDSNLPILSIYTESEQIEASLFQQRLLARLSSFFGGLSLLLACIGLYGLLSYEVSRKTREIGVRMALGAAPSDVLRFIVRQGIVLSAVGAVLGILGALGVTRYLTSLLYGVRPFDPLTFLAIALLLGLVALAACYIPARRASHVDPLVALRYE
ncbi:MAG TPA: ABC transporter permease [Candidatus Acidoferrum sp.]|nr:ABC transporter permease [Candidatus Acidoferrum sp.]